MREEKKKVLNLYSGLGGNRKMWKNVDVTAVDINKSIADFYKKQYPEDEVIVGDAHDYLKSHFREFDFIWSSISCPSHSRARFWASKGGDKIKPIYPDLKLYEEILFLKHYFEGMWCVENVVPYYKPLISPSIKIGRHLFWCNYKILPPLHYIEADIKDGKISDWQGVHGIDISGHKFTIRKDKLLRNCVNPELGRHVFEESKRIGLFKQITC